MVAADFFSAGAGDVGAVSAFRSIAGLLLSDSAPVAGFASGGAFGSGSGALRGTGGGGVGLGGWAGRAGGGGARGGT